MSAHNSVIGARIKQTRNANRKRQEVPFNEGDFVYLSTKNITFAKGLARKFIPKYIGPYKIIRDFGNQSFRLELPMHLRKRGIHDVFHASLLRIHVPNDDRLFPGRMDTQLGDGPNTEDEWAVDRIRSHAGIGEGSVFEILWKSGDVTWMPFYQIRHLQALETYLELMGVENASKLPAGKGKPPSDDPQVFLGGLSICSSPESPSQPLSQMSPVSCLKNFRSAPFSFPFLATNDFSLPLNSSLSPSSCLFHLTAPPLVFTRDHFDFAFVIMLDGINHPNFRRASRTEYTMSSPGALFLEIIHVGQIAKYIAYDKSLLKYVRSRLHISSSLVINPFDLLFTFYIRSCFTLHFILFFLYRCIYIFHQRNRLLSVFSTTD